jgi:hypothetical protein
MRQKQPRSLVRCCRASGTPPGRSLLRSCHIICRACKRYYTQGSFPSNRVILVYNMRHELRQSGACCHQEKNVSRCPQTTRHLMRQRGFSLFLLEQQLAAFGDSNPGRKTTLILTINTCREKLREILRRFSAFWLPNALLTANLCDNPANLCDNRAFLGNARRHDDVGIV